MTRPASSGYLGPAPDRVAVVGAGMVGLATAWFLQERGIDVTVFDREHVAAGASWGNAGWLTPAIATPLPEPAVLRYGLRTVLQPSSPVYVPARPDPRLWRFLAGFTRHCTPGRWRAGMSSLGSLNEVALDAFDELTASGRIPLPEPADPFLICYRDEEERAPMLEELEHIRGTGQAVDFDALTGAEVQGLEPALSASVGAGVRLHGQRFINPPAFVHALALDVLDRGGKIREGTVVESLRDDGPNVALTDSNGDLQRFHAVVVATGARLGTLARPFGVRRLVQAGRGYSFDVACRDVPRGPVYFAHERVACTPIDTAHGRRLRVAGMMEFRHPDEELDRRRIAAIVDAARPYFDGVDLDDRHDEWVGSRPCTTDGLPLIGPTTSPRVLVAGGHGMWGIVHGPATGRLLAERIATGVTPEALAPFDPMR